MALFAQLNQSTALTPSERERDKTSQQRAEDVIYTLNHALTCLSVTDFLIAPAIGALSQKWFGTRVDICGHDHGQHGHDDHHGHHHDHDHHGHAHAGEKKSALARAGNWIIGEAVGDVGAVLVTVPIQRLFPGFMHGLRTLMEPLVGGLFQRGAQRASQKWADKHGLDTDAPEVVARAQKLYEYEMSHLPLMAVWTASSIGINYAVMRALDKEMTLGTFTKGKAIGSAVTAGLVFGVRALTPDKAHKWDETAGKHVVVPLTKSVGKLFGLQARDVDDYHTRRGDSDTPKSWADKVSANAANTTVANARSA